MNRFFACYRLFFWFSTTVFTSAIFISTNFALTRPTFNKPDLMIVMDGTVFNQSRVAPGDTITIDSLTVKNQGTEASGFFSVGCYLSTDDIITTDDLYLGGYNHRAGLAPEDFFRWTEKNFDIPEDTLPGRYFLGIFVDSTGMITESDESNNIVTYQLDVVSDVISRLIPNLLPSSDTINLRPATVNPGGEIIIPAWTIQNNGTTACDAFSIGYYLTSGPDLGRGDTLLGQDSVRYGLAAGESRELPEKKLVIPETATAGDYYVLIVVDNAGVVKESNETDNTLAVSLVIQDPSIPPDLLADLTLSQPPDGLYASPPVIRGGGALTISPGIVLNQGQADSGPFACGYYLSEDNVITLQDQLLTRVDFPIGLTPGENTQLSEITVTVPLETLPGEYFLGIRVYETNGGTESDETNNTFLVSNKLVVMSTETVSITPMVDLPFEVVSGNNLPLPPMMPDSQVMPVPVGQHLFSLFPTVSPAVNKKASVAAALGLGSVAHGGDIFSLKVMLGQFTHPVDLYLAILIDIEDVGSSAFLFLEDGSLKLFDEIGFQPWKKGVSGPVSEDLLGDIPVKLLPSGQYSVFLLAMPSGSHTLENYYMWSSSFKNHIQWQASELDQFVPDWRDMLVENTLPRWVGELLLQSDLSIISTNPVQVLDGAPLVQGKGTVFRVKVYSSFLQTVNVEFGLSFGSLPFEMWEIPDNWPEIWGPVAIQPGINEILLPYVPSGRENNPYDQQIDPAGIVEGTYYFGTFRPDKRVLPKPSANYCSYTVTVDPENKIQESNEDNNARFRDTVAVPAKSWNFLFVPVYNTKGTAPRLGRVFGVAKRSMGYLLGTFPIPDEALIWSVAAPTNTLPCPDNNAFTCGYAAVWEKDTGRGTFFSQLLEKTFVTNPYDPYATQRSTDEFDFVVAVTWGSGGGAVGGVDKIVAIGEEAGDQILAHEFTHAVLDVNDMYSTDCLVGWDEAYCEHADGSREYCCIGGVNPDHSEDYFCSLDAERNVHCDYSGLTKHVCSKTCTDYQSCRSECSAICSDGTVFSGPDARNRHPVSQGFWPNKWREINDTMNYFMDARIEAGAPYPMMWNVLGSTTYHCYWGFGPVEHSDGFLNILKHPRFKK